MLAVRLDKDVEARLERLAQKTGRTKTGRTVTCQLKAAPMEQAMNWLAHYERYWTEQLDRLAAFLEEDSWQASPASPSSGASKRRRRSSSKPGRSRKK